MEFFPYPENFMAAKYDFNIRFRADSFFETFPGPFFRSVLGMVLRDNYCSSRELICKDCEKRGACVYALLHEAPFDREIDLDFEMSKTNYPKPFFITPTATPPYRFGSDNRQMTIEVTLIGKCAGCIREVIHAFITAGNYGVGKNRYRFDLTSVADTVHKKPLFENSEYLSDDIFMYSVEPEADEFDRVYIGVEFLTPVRLQRNRKLIKEITFFDIWKTIVKRVAVLSAVYGGRIANSAGITETIEMAKQIVCAENRLRYSNLERYSSSQKRVVPLDGMTGRLFFADVPRGFLPVLKTGEIIHIGKGLTSGLGKFRVMVKTG